MPSYNSGCRYFGLAVHTKPALTLIISPETFAVVLQMVDDKV